MLNTSAPGPREMMRPKDATSWFSSTQGTNGKIVYHVPKVEEQVASAVLAKPEKAATRFSSHRGSLHRRIEARWSRGLKSR